MEPKLHSFLKELKRYGIEHDIPNVTEKGGRFLSELIRKYQSKSALEIGSANGYSTIWIADALKSTGGKLISIDFSKPTFESAVLNLKKAGLSETVAHIFGNALEVVPGLDPDLKFDFVFVDGEKRSYWNFWNAIEPSLTDNAVVVFDDVLSFPEKTKDFMDKIKTVVGFDQIVLPIDPDDGILLLTKRPVENS